MKDKRGLAIEMALIVMFIVFALSIVLVTVAELIYKSDKTSMKNTEISICVDAIGDKCLKNVALGNSVDLDIEDTEYEVRLIKEGTESETAIKDLVGAAVEEKYIIEIKCVSDEEKLTVKFEIKETKTEGNSIYKLSVIEWRNN